MNYKSIFFLVLGLDVLLLVLQISGLSISYYEANLLYNDFLPLQYLLKTSFLLFGQNDYTLRLPMILMHVLSVLLLFKISKNYVYSDRNRLWLSIIFILLPGVISSAIIVDSAGLILFGLLLFIYVYQNFSKNTLYPLLAFYVLLDGGFLLLFLGLALYSISKKDKNFFIFNILAFFISLFLYGIDTHGTPKGHFLDSIGLYAAIFTPIIFIYIFYALYRKYLNKDMNVIWYISSTALIVSLSLSFRQKIHLEHFAPYLIIALPLMAQVFIHSYRVRLPIFRKKYKAVFAITLGLLLVHSTLVFLNKYIYVFIDNPKKHFAYKMHVAKELATQLQSININCIDTDERMLKRLKFYNVTKCNNYHLTRNNLLDDINSDVTISYKNRVIYKATVTKLNIN